jgi:tRNA (guanine37-N1)-methyltransferase
MSVPKFNLMSFKKTVNLVGLEIKDKQLMPHIIRHFDGVMFNQKDFRAIHKIVLNENSENPKNILIMFFSPDIVKFEDTFDITNETQKTKSKEQEISIYGNAIQKYKIFQIDTKIFDVFMKIKNDSQKGINKNDITSSNDDEWINNNFEIRPVEITMTHTNFTTNEILSEILPKDIIIPTSFEQIGHIAHLNLLDSQLPYKYIIGEVFLEMNKKSGIRTVVNKVESLSSEFRELHMEVIAGITPEEEPEIFTTKVKQHGIEFIVPLDKVYWNSRLEFEHKRFVDSLSPTDILYDVMAGVGPFAIPAGLKGMEVYANDLNPAAIDALKNNWEKNKNKKGFKKGNVNSYVMDGRKFIEMIRDEHLVNGPVMVQENNGKTQILRKRHFVMNLPALAVTFLDAFTGIQWKNQPNIDKSFIIHVYLFSSDKTIELAKKNAIVQVAMNMKIINNENDEIPSSFLKNIMEVYYVRDVAPLKYMFLVTFQIPESIF